MKSTANFLDERAFDGSPRDARALGAYLAELACLSSTTTAAIRLEVDGGAPRMWLAADLCEVFVDDRLDATGEPGEVGL